MKPTHKGLEALRPCHDKVSLNTRNVPRATRDAFKSYCASRGYTMEAAIVAMMKRAIREDLKLPEARK